MRQIVIMHRENTETSTSADFKQLNGETSICTLRKNKIHLRIEMFVKNPFRMESNRIAKNKLRRPKKIRSRREAREIEILLND